MAKKHNKPIPQTASANLKPVNRKDLLKIKLVFYAFGFSGCAALIYEVLWTRELSLVFGSTVYAVSTMLTAFMAGLSVGSFFGGKFADRAKNLVFIFGCFELGIGVFGLLTIPLINSLPTLYFFLYNNLTLSFFTYYLIQFVLCFAIMIIPTSLMGATFPIVSKIQTKNLEEVGQDVGGVYAINTVGAIAGSFLPGFILIPILGVKATTLVAAGLNLFVGSVMLTVAGRKSRNLMVGGAVFIFTVLGVMGLYWNNETLAFNWSMIKDYPDYTSFKEFQKDAKPKYFAEDSHGTVAVYETSDGNKFLLNGGRIEGGSAGIDLQTTALLAYLPVLTAKDPKNALVIGLGTGNTLKQVARFPLDRIVCAEIVKKVIPASEEFIGKDVFNDSRVEMVIADARNYLYTTPEKFDVITSEPSHPMNTSVSNLFTYDFYKLAQTKMTDDGIFTQWIPRYLLKRDDFIFMLKTFTEVFPHTVVWASYEDAAQAQEGQFPLETIFIGSQQPLSHSIEEVMNNITPLAEKEKLTLFYGPYLTEDQVNQVMSQLGSAAPLNTDDKPILEFVIPRNVINFAYQEDGSQF